MESVIEEHRMGVLVAPKRAIEEDAVYLAEYNQRLLEPGLTPRELVAEEQIERKVGGTVAWQG